MEIDKFSVDVAPTTLTTFFAARRYANSVYAVVVCLSVCLFARPSVTSQYCIETTGRMKLVFGMGAHFHLSYTVI